MNASDLTKNGAPFEKNGDVWLLESWFGGPSCTMVNPATGERESFGMGGLTAETFKPLDIDPNLFLSLMDKAGQVDGDQGFDYEVFLSQSLENLRRAYVDLDGRISAEILLSSELAGQNRASVVAWAEGLMKK